MIFPSWPFPMTPVIPSLATCHPSQLLPASEAIHHHAALETAARSFNRQHWPGRIVGSSCLFGPKTSEQNTTEKYRKASHVSKAHVCFHHLSHQKLLDFNFQPVKMPTCGMRWSSWWNDSVKNKSLAQPGKSQYHQYLNGKLIYFHCLLSKSDISLYNFIYTNTHEASQGRIEYQYNIAIP